MQGEIQKKETTRIESAKERIVRIERELAELRETLDPKDH